MESRVDRYDNKQYKQSRVEKNQNLYKMIYSAYDEFENYKVPLEEREIDLSSIKKGALSRSERNKNYSNLMNKKNEMISEEIMENDISNKKEVYDIKTLLEKVKSDNPSDRKTTINEEKYLDKLHLKNNFKTNLEKMKEEYEDIMLDNDEEKKLSNTANLSLEILSDLKSNENTLVTPPMKVEDEEDENDNYPKIKKVDNEEDDGSFYSDMYKFKKKDFEDNLDDDDDDEYEEGNNNFLFKILIIMSMIILMGLVIIYLVGYFSK